MAKKIEKDKAILGWISLGLFILVGYIIISQLSLLRVEPASFEIRANSLLFLFNLSIILIWISWGGFRGSILLFICTLFVLFISLMSSMFKLLNQIPIFITIGAISQFFLEKTKGFARANRVQKEKLQERKNALLIEIGRAESVNKALNKKLKRYSELKALTETLSSTLSVEELVDYVANESLRLIEKSQASLLYLVDEQRQVLNLAASRQKDGLVKIKSKEGDILDQWALREAKPLIVGDTENDFRFDPQQIDRGERQFKSLIACPLIAEKKILGILRLDSTSKQTYSLDDLRFLGVISDLAAVAIKGGLLYKRTTELAIIDDLTGLYLRRYYSERLDEELARARLTGSNLSILMVDIDYFKDYNDRYGHVAGDIVLRHIGELLNSLVNAGDIVCRYGGEEFAILLTNTQKEEALKRAETIRERVEQEAIILRRRRTKVTISIGVAAFPVDAQLKDELIKRVDEALYKAKGRGRNRICTV